MECLSVRCIRTASSCRIQDGKRCSTQRYGALSARREGCMSIYVAGADALRYGDAGRAAQEMTRIATEREFDMKEDLEALTLYGTSKARWLRATCLAALMWAAARGYSTGPYI